MSDSVDVSNFFKYFQMLIDLIKSLFAQIKTLLDGATKKAA